MSLSETAVPWFEWSTESFTKAKEEDKPILLFVTATWCPWCRQMDRLNYNDKEIISIINEHFVPIRVDADRRPDIFERYNLGGLPTTAFLNAQGEILCGGTYVSRERLPDALHHVVTAYRTRQDEIDERVTDLLTNRRSDIDVMCTVDVKPERGFEVADWVRTNLSDDFDSVYGGFGVSPKFTHTEALQFLLDRYLEAPDDWLRHALTLTLDSMGWSQVYDELDGGFFSHALAQDWTNPQLEKQLDTNANLLRVYLDGCRVLDCHRFRERAEDIIRYVQAQLSDPIDGGFFSSQHADEEYYQHSTADARFAVPSPLIDKTLYVDANALMVSAYISASERLDDATLRDFAILSLERVLLETYRPGFGVAHHHGGVRGLLLDQIRAIDALLDVWEVTENNIYTELAEELMHYCLRVLWDKEGGGFFDRDPSSDQVPGSGAWQIGLLSQRFKPFLGNCAAANALLRLGKASGDPTFQPKAMPTLRSQSSVYRRQGPSSAAYARAALNVYSS